VIIGDIVKANFNLAYDSILGSLNGRVCSVLPTQRVWDWPSLL